MKERSKEEHKMTKVTTDESKFHCGNVNVTNNKEKLRITCINEQNSIEEKNIKFQTSFKLQRKFKNKQKKKKK